MSWCISDRCSQDDVTSEENLSEEDESKLPLQLAIVGRPNVGKSTLLNALLEEERVLVGPEAGLTRDAVRVQFEFQGRTVYMVRLPFSLAGQGLTSSLRLMFYIGCLLRLTLLVGWREQSETKDQRL